MDIWYIHQFRIPYFSSANFTKLSGAGCQRYKQTFPKCKLIIENYCQMGLDLEQRHYKHDIMWSSTKLILKLPLFFTHLFSGRKNTPISKSIFLSTKRGRSYMVFALALFSQKSCTTRYRFAFFRTSFATYFEEKLI